MNDDPKLTAAIREIDRLYAAGRTADALILTPVAARGGAEGHDAGALSQAPSAGHIREAVMSRYPSEDVARFDQQFRETADERNDRLRNNRLVKANETLRNLIADLSSCLADEFDGYSDEGLESIRRRVANALPPSQCPDWLVKYRDPPIVSAS